MHCALYAIAAAIIALPRNYFYTAKPAPNMQEITSVESFLEGRRRGNNVNVKNLRKTLIKLKRKTAIQRAGKAKQVT